VRVHDERGAQSRAHIARTSRNGFVDIGFNQSGGLGLRFF
jgi:hypothetical protein